ncbi:hypothetical protein CK203_060348 [Vitis vinifera]|uniref:RNase H type-1 domain-containing protein n=1 Tax=Vitis vinifera TaxID=29760 RepID=A0A438FRX7_VITVI|nr:hypothetical protein CK203_060348 [Vitis vinifera]
MLTVDRATCIEFSDDDLPPEGSNHVRHLFIDVVCSGRWVPSVLLDNGSALNVCPLVTAIALRFSPADFRVSTQTVRAYDGTQRTVMGTLSTHVMIGPVSYSIVFQVLRIRSSFNLLLGRPWIHEAGAIPYSLHQKVKFIHEGHIITIQSDRDIITSSEPVLHISHSENDLHLTGFTFDEVQVVSLEDGSRDMVPMSFDQHSSTLVLSMMRGMSYLPGMGLGHRQQGPHEFTFAVDHDTPYGLGYIPTKADARYMARLRRDRLADYFIKGSEHTPRTEGTVRIPETVEIQDIQQALGQMHLDIGTTETPGAMIVHHQTELMDMIGIGRIFDDTPRGPYTAFDMFGVSVLETDEDESIPDAYTDDMDFIGIVLDVVTFDFTSVEGASDSVDPPLFSDTMFRFVTRFDDISDDNNDMSIFKYLTVSQHFPLIAPLAPTTHIYDVDDVGDTDDPLGGHSECDSDTEDEKVTPISGSTELIDFGAPNQPREIRIGSSLSPDERSRLIDRVFRALGLTIGPIELIKGSIVVDHLASLPISDDRSVDDDFPDEQIVSMTSITGWWLYYDGAPISRGLALLEIHGDSNLVIQQTQGIWRTRDEKLKPYHAYLDLLIDGFDVLRCIHLPRAKNQFVDALATLDSMIVIPAGVTVRPLLIETRSAPTYYCLIGEIEDQIELPWYHDIYQFLSCDIYPESTSAKDRRALRQLATRFVICGDALYRRSPDGLLLLCLDRTSADRVMREVHAGVCGPHMGGHMLALWGVDIIGKISPKSSSGHEYILVAIDYFTKWVEATSYARLTVPRGEVDTLIQEYGIQHHISSAYRPQTNGAVEAANKNIKRILRKMVETSRIVLPIDIEMRSLRVALEQHVSEAEWVQSRYDQLSLLDDKRLRAANHAQAYQRKMTRAFRKRVRLRKFQRGDLILKVLRGLISDLRGKFRPSWSGPYVIRDLTREGAAWLIDLDGNQFTEPVNVDHLKNFYA